MTAKTTVLSGDANDDEGCSAPVLRVRWNAEGEPEEVDLDFEPSK